MSIESNNKKFELAFCKFVGIFFPVHFSSNLLFLQNYEEQLTFEQHEFKLYRSTFMLIFFQ